MVTSGISFFASFIEISQFSSSTFSTTSNSWYIVTAQSCSIFTTMFDFLCSAKSFLNPDFIHNFTISSILYGSNL